MIIFNMSKNRILQLINKKKLEKWTEDLPLKYIMKIRSNTLPKYRTESDIKIITGYIDEVLNEIVIPKIKETLSKFNIDNKEISDEEEQKLVEILTRIDNFGKDYPIFVKKVIVDLKRISTAKSKDISSLAKRIAKDYE